MENEAVESEDEYQGVGGGADGEFSDEENSEDERLIDDASNVKMDESELRQKFAADELKEDNEQVAKTFKDVTTHSLSKRRHKDGVYAQDLSDDDDEQEILMKKYQAAIRKRMLKEQREMEKHLKKVSDKDPKKPFYDTLNYSLVSHISIEKDPYTASMTDLDDQSAAASQAGTGDDVITKQEFQDYYNNNPDPEYGRKAALKRRKLNKTRSFRDDDDIRFSSFQEQESERARFEVLSEDDEDDDDFDGSKHLKKLKKSKISKKLNQSSQRLVNLGTQSISVDGSDSMSFGVLAGKSTSITASFKKATEKKVKISANTGKVIREVEVTTSSKAIGNSKGAVTKLANASLIAESEMVNKQVVKGSGADRLDKMLAKSRKLGIRKITRRR